jgi:hypothetical protein
MINHKLEDAHMKKKNAKAATKRGVVSAPGCSAVFIPVKRIPVNAHEIATIELGIAMNEKSKEAVVRWCAAIGMTDGTIFYRRHYNRVDCGTPLVSIYMQNPKLTIDAHSASVRSEETP